MVLSHYLYKGTNTQHVAGMQERSYDFSKGGGGVKQMKLTGLSSRPPCRVYSERSSSPKHTMSYFEQREKGFQLCPNGKKMCDKKMWGVMGTPGCCSEKQSRKLRKFKAHSHLPPHCPPTWKYTNHFSLTTSGFFLN